MTFARAYYHWFFLIQPEPLPSGCCNTSPFTLLALLTKQTGGAAASIRALGRVPALLHAGRDPRHVRGLSGVSQHRPRA